jgi:hypothetical protein
MNMNFQNLNELRTATMNARKRTGQNIGTQAKAGKLQVVRVDFPAELNGASIVTPMSGYLPHADAVKFLNQVAA